MSSKSFGASAPGADREGVPPFALDSLHSGQECSRIIEFARLSLRPRVELRRVHQDLAVRREFKMRAVHRTRRGTFKVDALAVVSTAVTWTFEFVLAGFPVRSAAQVRAACIDDEEAIRRAIDPDAIFLLKFRINTQRKLGRIANLEN